jgi:cobalt-zinc-cadmium resistance protein CzcA
MIDNLIAFSIRNKLIIGLFTLILIAWGLVSLSRLPIDAIPDITNNQVQVITTSPTLAAQEVEQFITFPVEMALANVPDVIEIRSISRFGLSVVTVVFKDKVDVFLARQLVNERLQSARSQIPEGLGTPELAPISTGLGEIYQYVLHTKEGAPRTYSPTELRTFQDWVVRRQLLGTPGVADVSSFGGLLKQYEVAIDPQKLRSFNVSMTDIFTTLEQNNENTGGAFIEKGPRQYFIRGIGLAKSMEDIENIVIKNVNSIPLLIRDVATVQEGHAVRYGALTRNGEGEVVGGIVMMLKGENSAQVIQNIKERVVTIQKSLPAGVVLEPFLDRSNLVNRAISTVSRNLIEGGLIVIFVLVLLLGNLRAGLVVASVIPLSMLFAIAMMQLFGVSGNLMSLGAIDFGLIVDGAVIIVESIVLRITQNKAFAQTDRLNQNQMDDLVLDATVKIRHSAAFGEIIILIVYLPILALVGIEGKMFRPMAETVGFAILGALILSLTYVPMASALFLSKKTHHKVSWADKMMARLEVVYERYLIKALLYRKSVLLITVSLLAVALIFFSRLGGEFIPTLDEGDFAIESAIAPGSSLTQSVKTYSQAERILLKQFPEVKEVISKIGAAEIPTDPMPVEAADITVIMKDKSEWTSAGTREELVEKMEEALSVIPGLNVEFSQPIQLRSNELITGVKQDIAIKIFGEDLDVLYQKANEAAALIQPIAGVGDLKVEQIQGLPQVMVTYDRARLAQYGLNVSDLNKTLSTAFAGGTAGAVYEGERRFALVVRLSEASRHTMEDVEGLYVTLPNGSQLPLSEVATIAFQEAPSQISREDAKRRITIGINARERDVESLVEEIQQKLNQDFKLPSGYFITYGGQFENLQAAKARLGIAVPVALALILLLLFLTFRSFKQSLLIFTAIPLAAIGGVFALVLRGMPFSISAGIGFIALFGVAVLNGIVMIGYFNQLRKEGVSAPLQRILQGTKVRLRPVLMTAAVASLGFLPMALSATAGAEVQKPLATVVIGGLITSTLLTLFVLPVLYSYVEKMKTHIKKPGAALMILFLVSLSPFASFGQVSAPRPVTLPEAIEQALENNPGVQAAALEVDAQTALKGTAFELPRTEISGEYGQLNSLAADNSLSISQGIALPKVYKEQARLTDAQVAASSANLQLQQQELIRRVKLSYMKLAIAMERRKLLGYQDSLFLNFQRAADLRYKTGEANYLEKIAAEGRAMEARNALVTEEANIRILAHQLQQTMNSPQAITVEGAAKPDLLIVKLDTVGLNLSPALQLFRQQIEVSQAQTGLEKARQLPEFFIGATSQTFRGYQNTEGVEQYFGSGKRFHSIQAGISLPLYTKAQKARVKASQLEEKVAEAQYQNQQLLLQTRMQQLAQEYNKYQQVHRYYSEKALPQAELIIRYATKGFQLGETGYIEFIQNLTQAIEIKLKYLETINQLNEVTIQAQYLLGQN